MTGTIHARAIACTLRMIAATEVDDARAWSLLNKAVQLEASAPPATIDSTWTGGEPPVGTVLACGTCRLVFSDEPDYWYMAGEANRFTWTDVLHHALEGEWTVLRWGTDA